MTDDRGAAPSGRASEGTLRKLRLVPNANLGFRRAGEVTSGSLSFTDGSNRYDIQSTSRIAPAGGRFNLYVLHDPEWRPVGDESNPPIIVGAADRAE